jgi:glutamate-1-semialdehyde 2,1-aminomutase
MFTLFFREEAPYNFEEVKTCDMDAFGRFFRAALNGGIYLPPSQYEAAFLSHALTDRQVDAIVGGITAALVSAHA